MKIAPRTNPPPPPTGNASDVFKAGEEKEEGEISLNHVSEIYLLVPQQAPPKLMSASLGKDFLKQKIGFSSSTSQSWAQLLEMLLHLHNLPPPTN